MFCKYCGHEVSSVNIACTNCGAKTETFLENYFLEKEYEEKNHKEKDMKKEKVSKPVKTWNIIAGYILAVIFPILGVLCGVYLVWKERPKNGAGVLALSLLTFMIYLGANVG